MDVAVIDAVWQCDSIIAMYVCCRKSSWLPKIAWGNLE